MTDADRAPAAAVGEDRGPAAAAAGAWLSAFEQLAGRAGHGVRNVLNAVAVNLEVVRARSARGADPAAIAPFAATAAAQFETASAAVEALLSLARPERGVADPAAILQRMGRLLAVVEGADLDLVAPATGSTQTPVSPNVVRAALARSVLSALTAAPRAACETTVGQDILVRVSGAPGSPPALDPGLVALAGAHGVRITTHGPALELRFPGLETEPTAFERS